MKNSKFLIVLVLIALVVTGCTRSATKTPTQAVATATALMPAPTATAQPSAIPIAEKAASVVVGQVRLTSGVELNWKQDADKYRQKDGTYLIPVSDLRNMNSSAAAILFEGEYAKSVGIHSICYVTGEVALKCNQDDSMHINQGSFWAYLSNPKGLLPDDLLAAFAHDKWQNWHDQKIEGNPIEVFTSTGIVSYAAGQEPILTPEQASIVDQNAAERCPADSALLMENPYSDASDATGPVVIGAPGSFACRTLFIGKLQVNDNLVAYYWRGAKDGFSYVAAATGFYLIPESWGQSEIGDFAVAQGATFLGQYNK